MGTLSNEFPDIQVDDYISFFSLRQHGQLPDGSPIHEQVYVHSKLMIVDDRVAIIGSANINDRSLRGSRDSEIAVIVEDGMIVPSRMNGNSYMVGRFAHSLRMRLWRLHLGLDPSLDELIRDPIIDVSIFPPPFLPCLNSRCSS